MSNDPRTEAQTWIADYLRDAEAPDWDELLDDGGEWSEGLDEWLRALPPTDPLCELLGIVMAPFCVDNDDRLQGILYFAGDTSLYLDTAGVGIDYRQYLTGLAGALALDHARWITHLEEAGDAARWDDAPPVLLSERDES
jgi:hypothetical protein